jgi:hypothetical protein
MPLKCLSYEAYGENSLSRAHAFGQHKRYSKGREDVKDDQAVW